MFPLCHQRLPIFNSRDGLGNISTRHPELDVDSGLTQSHPQLEISDRTGVEVAFDLIQSHPARTITYLALGPLTTLAHLVRIKGEQFRERIGRIVSMGGALDVPGNTSPVAECASRRMQLYSYLYTAQLIFLLIPTL